MPTEPEAQDPTEASSPSSATPSARVGMVFDISRESAIRLGLPFDGRGWTVQGQDAEGVLFQRAQDIEIGKAPQRMPFEIYTQALAERQSTAGKKSGSAKPLFFSQRDSVLPSTNGEYILRAIDANSTPRRYWIESPGRGKQWVSESVLDQLRMDPQAGRQKIAAIFTPTGTTPETKQVEKGNSNLERTIRRATKAAVLGRAFSSKAPSKPPSSSLPPPASSSEIPSAPSSTSLPSLEKNEEPGDTEISRLRRLLSAQALEKGATSQRDPSAPRGLVGRDDDHFDTDDEDSSPPQAGLVAGAAVAVTALNGMAALKGLRRAEFLQRAEALLQILNQRLAQKPSASTKESPVAVTLIPGQEEGRREEVGEREQEGGEKDEEDSEENTRLKLARTQALIDAVQHLPEEAELPPEILEQALPLVSDLSAPSNVPAAPPTSPSPPPTSVTPAPRSNAIPKSPVSKNAESKSPESKAPAPVMTGAGVPVTDSSETLPSPTPSDGSTPGQPHTPIHPLVMMSALNSSQQQERQHQREEPPDAFEQAVGDRGESKRNVRPPPFTSKPQSYAQPEEQPPEPDTMKTQAEQSEGMLANQEQAKQNLETFTGATGDEGSKGDQPEAEEPGGVEEEASPSSQEEPRAQQTQQMQTSAKLQAAQEQEIADQRKRLALGKSFAAKAGRRAAEKGFSSWFTVPKLIFDLIEGCLDGFGFVTFLGEVNLALVNDEFFHFKVLPTLEVPGMAEAGGEQLQSAKRYMTYAFVLLDVLVFFLLLLIGASALAIIGGAVSPSTSSSSPVSSSPAPPS